MRKNREELKQYYFVIKQLVDREIKRKYARSFLGVIWSVLNPLMTMAVMSMIFSTIFKRTIENYPIYYLTGTIFWQLFSGATNSAMTALVDNRTLLLKVKLPKQTFVLARIYTALTNFGYTCVAYVLMLVVFQIKISPTMLLFPIDVFFCLLFSMGIGYVLSILYVFFADIKYLYSIVLMMQKVIGNNPVFVYIAFARDCVMYQKWPETDLWIKMILWGIASFLIGYYVFSKKENNVMQKI